MPDKRPELLTRFRSLSLPPLVEEYEGIQVVRDDLLPGGTKARFLHYLIKEEFARSEIVYATPQEGGAQTALALLCQEFPETGLRLFVAKRQQRHPRVDLSIKLGAQVVECRPGYLTDIKKRAVRYVGFGKLSGANPLELRFGLRSEVIVRLIAAAARQIPKPAELWFPAGSGTLARGLALAWPTVPRFAVQVGHVLSPHDVVGAKLIPYWRKFSDPETDEPPFPSDQHYDRKAWKVCLGERRGAGVTFWNVAAPAEYYAEKISG